MLAARQELQCVSCVWPTQMYSEGQIELRDTSELVNIWSVKRS